MSSIIILIHLSHLLIHSIIFFVSEEMLYNVWILNIIYLLYGKNLSLLVVLV